MGNPNDESLCQSLMGNPNMELDYDEPQLWALMTNTNGNYY